MVKRVVKMVMEGGREVTEGEREEVKLWLLNERYCSRGKGYLCSWTLITASVKCETSPRCSGDSWHIKAHGHLLLEH